MSRSKCEICGTSDPNVPCTDGSIESHYPKNVPVHIPELPPVTIVVPTDVDLATCTPEHFNTLKVYAQNLQASLVAQETVIRKKNRVIRALKLELQEAVSDGEYWADAARSTGRYRAMGEQG